jgi:hypothetical protein
MSRTSELRLGGLRMRQPLYEVCVCQDLPTREPTSAKHLARKTRITLSCDRTRLLLIRWSRNRSNIEWRGSYGRSLRANNMQSVMSRRRWHSSENSCGNSGKRSTLSEISLKKKGDVNIRTTRYGENAVSASASTRFGVGGLKSQDASASRMKGCEVNKMRIRVLLGFTKNHAIEGEEAVGCRSSSHCCSRSIMNRLQNTCERIPARPHFTSLLNPSSPARFRTATIRVYICKKSLVVIGSVSRQQLLFSWYLSLAAMRNGFALI